MRNPFRVESVRAARIANLVAGAILLGLALALWLRPELAIRAEFAKQRMLLGADSVSLVVDGHRIVYADLPGDHPDAPIVVLVHGFTGSKENWYRMARALRGRHHVVMPDLPGWGQSDRKSDADYGFLAQSERLAGFVRAIGKGRAVTLVGHSMGGGIVALTTANHPELVSRVALLDAAGVRFADNDFGKAVLAGRNPFAVHDSASLERYLSTVFHVREARPWLPWPATWLYIAYRRREAPFEQRVLGRIGRSEERFLPGTASAKIDQPALLLWCREDRVIDPSALQLYAKTMPHASQVLLDDCGHMSLMERPGEAAQMVALMIEKGMPR